MGPFWHHASYWQNGWHDSLAVIQLAVNGIEPAPQGSKRHVGGGRMIEASKRVKPWRAAVAAEAMEVGEQISGACAVSIVFRFRRPKAHFKTNGELRETAPRHCITKKNDVDKCCRSTLDGLVQGAEKRYCVGAEQPGAVIDVMALG
jgi:crossover junction endodeoxyribonuclease RusA